VSEREKTPDQAYFRVWLLVLRPCLFGFFQANGGDERKEIRNQNRVG